MALFLYPDRRALAQVLKKLLAAGVVPDGDADHGVSEAIYCRDPDFNGVEICRDRDPADWPRDAQDNLAMVNHRLDVDPSLAETD